MDECDPYEFVQSVISVVGAKTFLIGKFHDGVIWLHLPEFISFFFSYLNFVIPEGCPKQKA